ncbi:hypothetical protein BJ878DRAFT_124617 [Calycina marina]|uniref:STB6-like N-terminal domain-containing protein n=1 Tax=Calycina marina TaxID=1763456 RepID=A0A9P8CE51_9HELO|nr:hypothetical protein BJ878DRAFT_124617 [Calycina marina]
MASRLNPPSAYGLNIHREEALTLERTTSQKGAIPKALKAVPSNIYSAREADAPQRKLASMQHCRFVFADPIAFRFIEADSATVVVERHTTLQGYELYIIEQWVCSRKHPTFVIAAYTGDLNHYINVGVLDVPADEEDWSPQLRLWFKASSESQARPTETPLGMLMVTNLSSFPSALTVISVPEGDVKKHRNDFVVNENLKRLGCSGRSGMSLAAPAGATQAKFSQLYKTSDRVPHYEAVAELVRMAQIALITFGKLEEMYLDGLLCDMTEKGISDWWTEIGSEFYNTEPTDGVLGPTTVAALLGTLMGARNRLNYLNAPVPKDAFDRDGMLRGIKYFQKNQKLHRSGILDRHTLSRLHNTTAKAAAGEGWAVPKAVKSTVAELSGKGGEMVMGMVGRDKAGIGDIETLDIDRFVPLVHGHTAKWLWLGKGKSSGHDEAKSKELPADMTFTKDDHGGYIWSNSRPDKHHAKDSRETRKADKERYSPNGIYSALPPGSATSMFDSPLDKDTQMRKTVIKSVTGKMNDASSRFGRIKDAVGLRGHSSKHSKDDGQDFENKMGQFSPNGSTILSQSPSVTQSPQQSVGKTFSWKNTPEGYQDGSPRIKSRISNRGLTESPLIESKANVAANGLPDEASEPKDLEAETQWNEQVKDIRRTLVAADPSIGGSVFDGGDLEGPVLVADRDRKSSQVLLRRRHSIPGLYHSHCDRHEAWWPRQMSFTDAEEAVLRWQPLVDAETKEYDDPWDSLQSHRYISKMFNHLFEKFSVLQNTTSLWVENQLGDVEDLDDQAAQDLETLQSKYFELRESHETINQTSQDLLGDERARLTELVRDIDVLGAKLEYEINALVSKVRDVEEGVAQFQASVEDLEARQDALKVQLNTETWCHWTIRTITGVGTPPYKSSARP